MRTFVAIEIDDGPRAALAEASTTLSTAGADVRWVRPELFHLTLKFLGEIPEERTAEAGGILRAIAATVVPFELALAGVSLFPSPKRPRVVAAHLASMPDSCRRLAELLDGAFEALDVAPSGRPFRPHLTLGRVRSKRGLSVLRKALERWVASPTDAWVVENAVLVRSDLGHGPPRYSVVHRAPLSG